MGLSLASTRGVRSRLFWVIVLLVSSGAATLGQSTIVSIVATENCPIRIESAEVDPGATTGLRVRYVVANPQRTAVERIIVTAATVNREQRVTAIRIQSVEGTIEPRGRREQYVVFPQLAPTVHERVVFGVQAVGWSGGKEWRGVLHLASSASMNAAR
jgi:hypothetical protein